MSDPSSDKDKLPEDEARARFDRAIKNALAMPHKPHKAAQAPKARGPYKKRARA